MAGFEPATDELEVRCSYQTELHSGESAGSRTQRLRGHHGLIPIDSFASEATWHAAMLRISDAQQRMPPAGAAMRIAPDL